MRELTHAQTQQGSVIPADLNFELCSLWDGLRNLVVDATVKLEDDQVMILLTAGVCDIPETREKYKHAATPSKFESVWLQLYIYQILIILQTKLVMNQKCPPHPVRRVFIRRINVDKSRIIPDLKNDTNVNSFYDQSTKTAAQKL